MLFAAQTEAASRQPAWAKNLSRSARIRYNRVEGLFLGYRLGLANRAWPNLQFFVEGGSGIHNRKPRGETGVQYRTPTLDASFTAFDRTETYDSERIGSGENSVFAALFKWDYRDYFRAKNGFETKLSYRIRRHVLLLSQLTAFTYESMPLETGWSLFYPDRPFRINPPIQPGSVGIVQAGAVYDNRRSSPLFRNAWRLAVLLERGFREFSYNGMVLELKRHQKITFGQQALVFQARLGTRESNAEQHLFDLGGVSTLRGFEIKEFTGNRFVLLNLDYRFEGDLLGRIPMRGFHLLNLVLFLDSGWVNTMPNRANFLEGFGDLAPRDFKTNAGLAIALPRQILRVNIARRLDRKQDPWVVSVRFKRDF